MMWTAVTFCHSFKVFVCMSIVTLFLIILTGVRASVGAEDERTLPTNSVVIDSTVINRLLREARTNNPALLAADARVRAAALNAGAVRTWEDPVGLFGGEVFSPNGMDPAQMGNLAYGIEERLPLWNRPRLSRRVAKAETLTEKADTLFRVEQVRKEITQALLRAALARRVVEIGLEDLAWLEATSQAADSKYRTGQGSVADTLQIQNEAAQRKDALTTDRRRLAHEHFVLASLLNRATNEVRREFHLPSVGPAIPLSAKLLSLARLTEPKLKLLEQRIRTAEATARLTHNSRLPDVSLGVEGRQFSGDGEFRSGMFTLRFSLPWANRDKYRKDYARDQEKVRAADLEKEDHLLTISEELHHLSIDIEASRREALLQSGEIFLRSSQALSSRLSEWQSGKAAFRDVLDARRMVLDSQLRSARAIAGQYQMFSEMLLWTGLENFEALFVLANEPPLFPRHEGHTTEP